MQRALRSVSRNVWPLLTSVHEMLKFAQDLKTCRKIAFARVSPHPEGKLMSSTSPQAPNSRPMPGTTATRFPATILAASPPVVVVIIAFEIRTPSSPRMSPSRPGGSSRSSGRWSEIAGEQPYRTSLTSPEVWVAQATRAYRRAGTQKRGRRIRRRSRWTLLRSLGRRSLSTKK
jgi:hypothetical protein